MGTVAEDTLLSIIFIMAATTFATRVAPFLLFSSKGEQPQPINYVGHYLPLMVMIVLVVYSFKDVNWSGSGHGIAEISGGSVTAFSQIYTRNVLVSIVSGVLAYAIAARLLL